MTIREILLDHGPVITPMQDPHRLIDSEATTWRVLHNPNCHSVGDGTPIIAFETRRGTVYLCMHDGPSKRWDTANAYNGFDYQKTQRERGERPCPYWILDEPV